MAAVMIALSLLAGGSVQAQTREDQALQNYQQVMNGQIRLSDLTPQEQADVIEVDRQVRARPEDRRSPEQRCYAEELKKLGTEPSYLARRSTALKCGIPFEEAEAGRAR
jgi:hypothetical protein